MVVKSASFFDFVRPPKVGAGVFSVWTRNFTFFRGSFLASVLWIGFEPVLYLLAFGWGVGRLVGPVNETPYIEFFMPALLVMTAMFVAFYEGTFNSRRRRQNLTVLLLSPVTAEEVVFGEILWAASKAFFSVGLLMAVAFVSGLINHWLAIPAVVVLSVCCWLFAAFGVMLQSSRQDTDAFVYAQTGLIIPMSLFCATYFPLSFYAEDLQKAAWFLPLTHAVTCVRSLMTGHWPELSWLHLSYLIVLAVIFTNIAVSRVSRQFN